MRKYFIFLFIILSVFLAYRANALVPVNSGFIPGQIWYSKQTLIEGDTVNIHTAIWNGGQDSLSAKIGFYDKNIILGSRNIVLTALELKDVYIPWKITSGDHVISAKIISSTIIILGKQEKVVLNRTSTSNDKQFVSAIAKNNIGEPVNKTDLLKIQIDKTSAEINNIIPVKVSTSFSSSFFVVENLRNKTFAQVEMTKNETEKEIEIMKSDTKKITQTPDRKSSLEDAIKEPIAYIKLYLFTILSFIIGSKIIFYGILILVIFYILRSIYRRIKNR